MKLATEIAWNNPHFSIPVERIQYLDKLGYDVVFSAEAHGSDALTPLGYVLGITNNIGVGTCIAQVWGRTPVVTAMAFQTLAAMAGERPVVVGLGNSNPASVESWHGVSWEKPAPRMRDYVEIMRKAFAGEPVSHAGPSLSVPVGEAQVAMAPLLETRPDVPILLGAGSETMIKLTAEIGDGWMPLGFALGMMDVYKPFLKEGFTRAAKSKKRNKTLADFDIWAHLDVIVSDDIEAAMRPFKEFTARYAGGWSSASDAPNIYKNQMVWSGYGDAQARIEELYTAGHHAEAADAVPDEYIDARFLLGPMARIAERAMLWRDAGPTGLIIRPEQNPGATDPLEIYDVVMRAIRG